MPTRTDLRRNKVRRFRYVLMFVVLMGAIWGSSVTYLKKTPFTYTSSAELILPGTGIGSKLALDDIGQASAVVNSAYSSREVSPKINYKIIAESRRVLKRAAQIQGVPVEEFGAPRIKPLDQSAVIRVQMKGKTPELAKQKTESLLKALTETLSVLRSDELTRREASDSVSLDVFRDKLAEAETRLRQAREEASLLSTDQHRQMATRLEENRAELIRLNVSLATAVAQIQAMEKTLRVKPSQVADQIRLNADDETQALVEEIAEARSMLTEYLGKWGENHHAVQAQKARLENARSAMSKRASALGLADPDSGSTTGPELGTLFQEYLMTHAEAKGLEAGVQTLRQAIGESDTRLASQTRKISELRSAERDVQIAEAVFSSVLAKVDTGKTDMFASYPMLQTLQPPTLVAQASWPKPLFIYGAAAFSSLLVFLGLILAWHRATLSQKIVRSVLSGSRSSESGSSTSQELSI